MGVEEAAPTGTSATSTCATIDVQRSIPCLAITILRISSASPTAHATRTPGARIFENDDAKITPPSAPEKMVGILSPW